MIITKVLLFLILTILSLNCSNPKDQTIPSDLDQWESDTEFKNAVQKLSDEDKKLFMGYVARAKIGEAFGGQGLKKNVTIGEALNAQLEWQKEQELEGIKQKELSAKLEKEKLQKLKEMNEAVTASLLQLKFVPSSRESRRYNDLFTIEVGFENRTDKDILGVKGIIVFKDIFGDLIKKVGLSNDEGIKANSTTTWYGTLDYNQFVSSDNKLRTTDFDKLKFEWEPEIYLFADGSSLKMPSPSD